MQPFSAHHLMTLYICTKFQENISKGFRVTEQAQMKYTKGHYSIKDVGGVSVLVLCTSPDNTYFRP